MSTTDAEGSEPVQQSEHVASSEQVQFSILRRGAREPEGPYSDQELLGFINDGSLSVSDLVYYEGMGDWRPFGEVFEVQEQISHFVDDGQDTEKVALA
ncbi:MAG: DUF4339 domain-containing protein, partial [Verrucomicrobiota bacterium]